MTEADEPFVVTELTMIRVRWAGVAFGLVQVLTYYRPYPPGILPLALGLVGFLAVANLALWLVARRITTEKGSTYLSATGLTVDTAIVMGFVSLYTFDVDTAIWALIYILPLEGAIKFQRKGALAIMLIAAILYTLREIFGAAVYHNELLLTSISYRMGLGFIIATVSGSTASNLVQKRAEVQRQADLLRHALEREHENAEQLRQVDDMRMAFVSAVSHDLRTPLSTILGFAKTLERALPTVPVEEAQQMASRIAVASKRLEKMLSDLMNMDRLRRGVLEPDRISTDIAHLADRVVAGLEVQDRNVEVVAEPTSASVDPVQTEHILQNLVANAIKHTDEDSSVWVRINRENGGVLIIVEDDGDGVPDDAKESIFEPFRQGGPGGSGTGIGLSLVAKFAELHGGRAWVEDRPGGGASFRVLLKDEIPTAL